MKHLPILSLIIVFFACNTPNNFLKLHALKGSWQMTTKDGIVGETWTIESPTQLSSIAYFINGSDTSFYETVVLTTTDQGTFYNASSTTENNKKPVPFKLTSAINNKFVFENATHDFPRKIVYEFINQDSIHASIDDGLASPIKKSDFYFSRIKL
jgi:Domain of unknown function (DUF6265)